MVVQILSFIIESSDYAAPAATVRLQAMKHLNSLG